MDEDPGLLVNTGGRDMVAGRRKAMFESVIILQRPAFRAHAKQELF